MYQQLKDQYRGKKVLVTGHTGFKGTWLTAMLHTLGAAVKGYSLAPEDSKPFFDLFGSYQLAEDVIADIRDKKRIESEVLAFQPDYIFHLAAQPLVLRSYEIPAETFDVNVTGTANLLEAVRKLQKACSVVVITTDKVYENKEQDVLYREGDRLGGYDPYSASKACTEIVVSSFRNSFFNVAEWNSHHKGIASARAGNVIGGGDWSKNRIVPDIARALLSGEVVHVRNPRSVRPWQHVLEPLAGYLLLGSKLKDQPLVFSKAFNFGPLPEDHLTVEELVKKAIAVWGKGSFETPGQVNQPHEATLLKLDIQSAREELGWQPKLDASAAIQWAMDWYKTDISMRAEYTFRQINNYFSP